MNRAENCQWKGCEKYRGGAGPCKDACAILQYEAQRELEQAILTIFRPQVKRSLKMDLQSLKSFDPAGYSVEEMVLMLATASAMIVSYKALGFEPPEWVVECEGKLTKEIKSRQRDAIEQELKELAGREEALKTATEKREDLGAKRKRLEEQRAKLG